MLIAIVLNINGQAQRRVDREILQEIKKVRGKNNILVSLLEALLENQNNVVQDVVFSVVEEETLRDLLNNDLKQSLHNSLEQLNQSIPQNEKVSISNYKGG